MGELFLSLFAFPNSAKPSVSLETRLKRFISSEVTSECLDAPEFSALLRSGAKADYLVGKRRFVAELKTITASPRSRLEQRLRARFETEGLQVLGRVGLSALFRQLPDGDELQKVSVDLSVRSVRSDIKQADKQILATKRSLSIPSAAGLLIIANEGEPLITASNIGYAVKALFDSVDAAFPSIDYMWISVEAHRVRLPDGSLGFPQLLVSRSSETSQDIAFLRSMLAAWAAENGATTLHEIDHAGQWDALRPVFEFKTPQLRLN